VRSAPCSGLAGSAGEESRTSPGRDRRGGFEQGQANIRLAVQCRARSHPRALVHDYAQCKCLRCTGRDVSTFGCRLAQGAHGPLDRANPKTARFWRQPRRNVRRPAGLHCSARQTACAGGPLGGTPRLQVSCRDAHPEGVSQLCGSFGPSPSLAEHEARLTKVRPSMRGRMNNNILSKARFLIVRSERRAAVPTGSNPMHRRLV
jgi:hypothetical protein